MGLPDRPQAVMGAAVAGSATEIAQVFVRVGMFGFGGPVAVMAMMEEEVVRRRAWLTAEAFGEVYSICKLLPGPVAAQMAIFLGRVRGGNLGGIVAGACYIGPAFVMVLALSFLYADTSLVRDAGAALIGLQAGALAVILLSTWGLARPYRRVTRAWVIVALSAAVVAWRPALEPLVILGSGAIGVFGARRAARSSRLPVLTLGSILAVGAALLSRAARAAGWAAAVAWPADPSVLGKLFWMCFKAGFLVFGTGLAVVPMLEGDSVSRFHWLSHSQFMDGLAIGQVTPGPIVITATFVGYLAAKLPGALAATAGMFLPSFINVLILVPRIWSRWSGTASARAFTDWAMPAVIGGILGTTIKLGTLALTGPAPIALFLAALAIGAWRRPPAWLLIPGAGVAGAILHALV